MVRPLRHRASPTIGSLVAAFLVALALTGCDAANHAVTATPSGNALSETGVVLQVVGTSPTAVTAFDLRTNDARLLTFTVGTLDLAGGFNAGHLREHQATAQPVRVVYVMEGDRRVAVQLTDGS